MTVQHLFGLVAGLCGALILLVLFYDGPNTLEWYYRVALVGPLTGMVVFCVVAAWLLRGRG